MSSSKFIICFTAIALLPLYFAFAVDEDLSPLAVRGICITTLLYRQKKLEINQQNISVNGIVMIIGHHVGTT
ncbi:hypothetical protein Tco_0979176, partial [Tanacetum coccineum]